MERVGLCGDPSVVDLSASATTPADLAVDGSSGEPKSLALPARLTMLHTDVLQQQKDTYTYAFLISRPLLAPGRTLIFVNSIASVRRVYSTLVELGLPVYQLHAEMQQRQRLKALDRFRAEGDAGVGGDSGTAGVMVATDVAARGLDIPSVRSVLHYDLPRTPDAFVHRSGRTARAGAEGTALCLVSEKDTKAFQLIIAALGRDPKSHDLPSWEPNENVMAEAQKRAVLAAKVVKQDSAVSKVNAEKNWFKRQAEEMEIELDDDIMGNVGDEQGEDYEAFGGSDERGGFGSGQKAKEARKARVELKALLSVPVRLTGKIVREAPVRKKIGKGGYRTNQSQSVM